MNLGPCYDDVPDDVQGSDSHGLLLFIYPS